MMYLLVCAAIPEEWEAFHEIWELSVIIFAYCFLHVC